MKKSIIYSFICCIGILSLAGCKKQVDLLPTDVILPAFAFTNVNDLQSGLNTAYARYDGELTSYLNTILSDEARLGRNNGGQGQFANRWQYGQDATTGGDVTAGWLSFYRMIQACNIVLDNIPRVAVTTSADSTKKSQIRAQAIALRALGLFELQQLYAKGPYNPANLGVPIVTTYVDPNTLPKPPRNTSGEVMNQIQTDLTLASSLLPAVTAVNFTDLTINRLNITGLQARVALYKGEWQKAIDSATFVINSNIRPLVGLPAFADIWTDVNITSEVLFRIKRNSSGSSVDTYYTTTTNAVYFSPSVKLRNSYSPGDNRINAYIATFNAALPNNYVVFKYFQSTALGGRINDLKAMRISEMYLIRAEALVESTGLATAGTADLTTLRTARMQALLRFCYHRCGDSFYI
ncbi:MAG: RagB/SusD family nutrient uptake outer membrane protein [Ferruginibacter sp.]